MLHCCAKMRKQRRASNKKRSLKMLILWKFGQLGQMNQLYKPVICLALGIISIVAVGGIGYYQTYVAPYNEGLEPEDVRMLRNELFRHIHGANIRRFLHDLTRKPHVAGTENSFDVAQYIHDTWVKQGMDRVEFRQYDGVLLSYPDYNNSNRVILLDENKHERYVADGIEQPIVDDEQNYTGAGVLWNAYSAPGIAVGKLVYVNYGRESDFIYLDNLNINISGKILIMRYGEIWRGGKIYEAQRRGAIGVILYSDPADVAPDGADVFPNTVFMPGGGSQRGTLLMTHGDPLTPMFPAKNETFRMFSEENLLDLNIIPKIPVTALGYDQAYTFLKRLAGPRAPNSWQGGLNFTYHIGTNFVSPKWTVKMDVNTKNIRGSIRNVIGWIYGYAEPDRYVIVGNHHDAWVYGAIDPSSGTATMLEMSRVFAGLSRDGIWRPRRTIIFCAWDGEEYGLIGSTEWVEEYVRVLGQRAVAYLNCDSITGNQTLTMATVPLLYRASMAAAQVVENPNPLELAAGRLTVYDTWIYTQPTNTTFEPGFPGFKIPGDGSDHSSFIQFAGVPVADFTYENITHYQYPLYHSLYETPYVIDKLMDKDDFGFAVATGQYWAELTRRLADSLFLPLNTSDYALTLQAQIKMLESQLINKLALPVQLEVDNLLDAVEELVNITRRFEEAILFMQDSLEEPAPLLVERLNSRLVNFERSFLSITTMPGVQTISRHLVFGSDLINSYKEQMFPGIHASLNAVGKDVSNATIEQLRFQIFLVQNAVQSAALSLEF